MSWEALGAIGEAMGGAGVVLTLLYLAIQVRQHTAEMRSQASESVAENLREWLIPMIEDPELSRIFRMGAMVRCQVRSVPWTDEVPALGRGPAPMSRTSPV